MKPDPDTDPVLAEVETFISATGITPTAFGVKALNDPTLVHEMRKGRECKRATRAKIREFIQHSNKAAAAKQRAEA